MWRERPPILGLLTLAATQHPAPVIGGGPDSGMDPDMALALGVALAALGLLYAYLVRCRVRLGRSLDDIRYLEQAVLE